MMSFTTAPSLPPGATLPPSTPAPVTPGGMDPDLVERNSSKEIHENRVDVRGDHVSLCMPLMPIVFLMSIRCPSAACPYLATLPGFHASTTAPSLPPGTTLPPSMLAPVTPGTTGSLCWQDSLEGAYWDREHGLGGRVTLPFGSSCCPPPSLLG